MIEESIGIVFGLTCFTIGGLIKFEKLNNLNIAIVIIIAIFVLYLVSIIQIAKLTKNYDRVNKNYNEMAKTYDEMAKNHNEMAKNHIAKMAFSDPEFAKMMDTLQVNVFNGIVSLRKMGCARKDEFITNMKAQISELNKMGIYKNACDFDMIRYNEDRNLTLDLVRFKEPISEHYKLIHNQMLNIVIYILQKKFCKDKVFDVEAFTTYLVSMIDEACDEKSNMYTFLNNTLEYGIRKPVGYFKF